MKKLILTTLILSLPLLGACNTLHGVGKDITAAGQAVEKATKK